MKWNHVKISELPPELLERVYQSLSPSRKARIDRITKDSVRTSSLAGEYCVRMLAGEGAVICCDEKGRPFLQGDSRFISITHSGDIAAAVISDVSVGIDCERMQEFNRRLIDRVCVDAEREFIAGGDEIRRFFEVWTAKEAYFKKLGTGITDLRSVNVLTLERKLYTLEDYIITII